MTREVRKSTLKQRIRTASIDREKFKNPKVRVSKKSSKRVKDKSSSDSDQEEESFLSVAASNSPKDLDWDHQADIESPPKVTTDVLDLTLGFRRTDPSFSPHLNSRERSVSVAYNRVLNDKVSDEFHPITRELNFDLINQDSIVGNRREALE